MSANAYAHPYVLDDVQQDTRTGGRIDGRTYSTPDAGSAFVIVLAITRAG